MTEQGIATLRVQYPELPRWFIERAGMTLEHALMELRRRAFPQTRQVNSDGTH
jgi:hypothetical protein